MRERGTGNGKQGTGIEKFFQKNFIRCRALARLSAVGEGTGNRERGTILPHAKSAKFLLKY